MKSKFFKKFQWRFRRSVFSAFFFICFNINFFMSFRIKCQTLKTIYFFVQNIIIKGINMNKIFIAI